MSTARQAQMWTAVHELVDGAASLDDLRWHGVHLLAAERRRRQGLAVPPALQLEQRLSAIRTLCAPDVLARVREVVDGPILLVKGPEIAARYPTPAARPFWDLDILVADSSAAQRAVMAAGLHEIGDPSVYRGIHHLRPLQWGDRPLALEVHHQPKWPAGLTAPRWDELVERAERRASVAVDGIWTLDPAAHALTVAAHAWAHHPLARLRHLIDVGAVAYEADRDELDALARRWGCRRMWRTTSRALDDLLGDGRRSGALRIWARHLSSARERTVFERHLHEVLAPLWGLPSHRGVRAAWGAVLGDVRREGQETWTVKLNRSTMAVRNLGRAKSVHDAAVSAAVKTRREDS
jgi:hypothetical protein